VWGKEADGILTLSCRAYGFYPRPIAISWMKDGMVRDQETHWGGIVPNSDGTYHASAAIDVLPEDVDKYWCRVEHTSLPQPGLFSWGEPGSVECVGLGSGGPPFPFLTKPLYSQSRSPTCLLLWPGQSAPSWLSLLLSLELWCGRASQVKALTSLGSPLT